MKNQIPVTLLTLLFTFLLSSACQKEDIDNEPCRSEVCFHNNSPWTIWVWQTDVTISGNGFEVSIAPNRTYCKDLGTGTGQGHTFKSSKTLNDCFSSPGVCSIHSITVNSCQKFSIDL